jgi:hypothetical protein
VKSASTVYVSKARLAVAQDGIVTCVGRLECLGVKRAIMTAEGYERKESHCAMFCGRLIPHFYVMCGFACIFATVTFLDLRLALYNLNIDST